MKLRFAWGAAALVVWIGCGGAFSTTIDTGADAGAGGGSTSGGTTGTTTTGPGGNASQGGSAGSNSGTAGSNSGTAGSNSGTAGSSSGTAGSSSGTGGAGGGTGGSLGTGGSAGSRGPDWGVCDGPGQCVALETSCCGSCGLPELAAFVGVNTKRVQDFHSQLCPNPVVCPACVQATNANIAARCVTGRCQAFDVRKVPEYSACDLTSDCHLRLGLGCCVCNTANASWVAVNKLGDQGIATAECAPNSACADCLPIPPVRTIPTCSNHVCQVLLAP